MKQCAALAPPAVALASGIQTRQTRQERRDQEEFISGLGLGSYPGDIVLPIGPSHFWGQASHSAQWRSGFDTGLEADGGALGLLVCEVLHSTPSAMPYSYLSPESGATRALQGGKRRRLFRQFK